MKECCKGAWMFDPSADMQLCTAPCLRPRTRYCSVLSTEYASLNQPLWFSSWYKGITTERALTTEIECAMIYKVACNWKKTRFLLLFVSAGWKTLGYRTCCGYISLQFSFRPFIHKDCFPFTMEFQKIPSSRPAFLCIGFAHFAMVSGYSFAWKLVA